MNAGKTPTKSALGIRNAKTLANEYTHYFNKFSFILKTRCSYSKSYISRVLLSLHSRTLFCLESAGKV